MNLPLHYGFLGVLEAGLIAFLVGVLMYLLWRALSRFFEFSDPLAIGWALATATLLAAGYDTWNMFYLGMVKLESTLYARLALQGIHNPEMLGTRVIVQAMAAWAGVVVAWIVLHRRLPFSETGDAGNEGGQ